MRLLLLDGYFQREVKQGGTEPVKIEIHPHTDIDIKGVDEERGTHTQSQTRHERVYVSIERVRACMCPLPQTHRRA